MQSLLKELGWGQCLEGGTYKTALRYTQSCLSSTLQGLSQTANFCYKDLAAGEPDDAATERNQNHGPHTSS